MSLEQLEEQIESLPREELGRLVDWLDRFLGRANNDDAVQASDLSGAEQAELLRRRDGLLANPALAQPMDDAYFANLKREVADGPARKASAG